MFSAIIDKFIEEHPTSSKSLLEIKKRAVDFSNNEHVQDQLIRMQMDALIDGMEYGKSFFVEEK